MQLPYNKVLLIGATSGIGQALAAKFVETGTSVVVVGRRKDKLADFVKTHSTNSKNVTVDSAALDVTDLASIPPFAAAQFQKHPDIDCVFLNSGIQRHVDFAHPEALNLETIDLEVLTNYTSFLHMTKAFLPHLQSQAPHPTALILTTSGLALVPSLHAINYCATKAALHHTILAMREQLRYADSNVRIVEVLPPAVQTELHDYEMGEKGKEVGMPLDEFVEEAFAGLCKAGREGEQVPVQMAKRAYEGWEMERQKAMLGMMEARRKGQ